MKNRERANPSFLRSLKESLDEDISYEYLITYLKSQYASVYDLQFLQEYFRYSCSILQREHKKMLAHCKEMLEYQNGQWVFIQSLTNSLLRCVRQ